MYHTTSHFRQKATSGSLRSVEPCVSCLAVYPSTVHWMISGLFPTGLIERGSKAASRDFREGGLHACCLVSLMTSPDISAAPRETKKREREEVCSCQASSN